MSNIPREQRVNFSHSLSKLSQNPNNTVQLIEILLFCILMSPRAKCQRSNALSSIFGYKFKRSYGAKYITWNENLSISWTWWCDWFTFMTYTCLWKVIAEHHPQDPAATSTCYTDFIYWNDARDSIQFIWNLRSHYNWFIKTSWFTKYTKRDKINYQGEKGVSKLKQG